MLFHAGTGAFGWSKSTVCFDCIIISIAQMSDRGSRYLSNDAVV